MNESLDIFSPTRRNWLKASAASLSTLLLSRAQLDAKEGTAPASMLVHSDSPPNSETVLNELVESWITPNEKFYVRSHAPTPVLKSEEFELSVEGLVHKPFKLRLSELQQRFKQHNVFATLTCAGNRRSEHSLVEPVKGVPWQAGAIGNAEWTGALLGDLLRRAELKSGAKHVWFEGVDQIQRSTAVIPFGASIPIANSLQHSKAMPGALVAFGMNGQPLPRDHGFPFRTLIPGMVGARSVKWLGKIIVSDQPSTNHYVATAYKLVKKGTPEEWRSTSPIYNFVCNSVTCLPTPDSKLQSPTIQANGYALADGIEGKTVAKVEVSSDGGKKWQLAKFTSPAKPYCWRLWAAAVSVDATTTALLVRTTDSAGKTQPMKVDWNLKGYMFNAWHKTPIKVN
ncbi:MAG: sulfite oxidase [Pirellulaceae bacterium]|jgi:sulfite oxidase